MSETTEKILNAVTEIILDYPKVQAERDRLKEINKKLLDFYWIARDTLKAYTQLPTLQKLIREIDAVIAEAKKEVQK